MSDFKMGPMISQIKDEVENRPSFLRKVLNVLKWQVAKVTWALWGRRRAFKKMRLLALAAPPPYPAPRPESEEERVSKHRLHLDSIQVKERLPPPDFDDSGLN